MKLYNTLTRKKETFKPIKKNLIGLYACGPTVYWYAHIGNLRSYIFEDVLKKTLVYNNYKVKHVINITDVGHLTSDADTGEDKMEKGAKRDKKTVWEIAEHYTDKFQEDIKKLNIKEPDYWTKATDYIPQQIKIIKELEKKNFAYLVSDGVYFDTSKVKSYGELWGSSKTKFKPGARVETIKGKRNPADFALWKITPKKVKREMEWDSPWGKGFPGWHTECVAMAVDKLGVPFDIHCGGTDHIPIHHTNEIAQSKALYGKNLANYWLHGEFLNLDKGKMSKSQGKTIVLDSLIEKGFEPLALRYLCLTAHYRSHLKFSWKNISLAQKSLLTLREKAENPRKKTKKTLPYLTKFKNLINDDLDTPKALALLWQLVRSKNLSDQEKSFLCFEFDKVFGLDLEKKTIIPSEIKTLVNQRELLRSQKNWLEADKKRKEIELKGYSVKDTTKGPIIKKISHF